MIPVQIRCINVEISTPEMLQIENNHRQAFDRFSRYIREAQLTFRDANGPRGGIDKLCTIQLRFYPRGIAVVKSSGTSFPQAAYTACERMQQVAARRLGKKNRSPANRSYTRLEEEHAYGN